MLRALKEYLNKILEIPAKEVSRLYGVRSKLSHGEFSATGGAAAEVVRAVGDIQRISLGAIKYELGLPKSHPPLIKDAWIGPCVALHIRRLPEEDLDQPPLPGTTLSTNMSESVDFA